MTITDRHVATLWSKMVGSCSRFEGGKDREEPRMESHGPSEGRRMRTMHHHQCLSRPTMAYAICPRANTSLKWVWIWVISLLQVSKDAAKSSETLQQSLLPAWYFLFFLSDSVRWTLSVPYLYQGEATNLTVACLINPVFVLLCDVVPDAQWVPH